MYIKSDNFISKNKHSFWMEHSTLDMSIVFVISAEDSTTKSHPTELKFSTQQVKLIVEELNKILSFIEETNTVKDKE